MTIHKATEVADLLKQNNRVEVVNALNDDYRTMSHQDFANLISDVQKQNHQDLKQNRHLPGITFETDDYTKELSAKITTPGKYLGSLWRDESLLWKRDPIKSDNTDALWNQTAIAANFASDKDANLIAQSFATQSEAVFTELRQPSDLTFAGALYTKAHEFTQSGRTYDVIAGAESHVLDRQADFADRLGMGDQATKLYAEAKLASEKSYSSGGSAVDQSEHIDAVAGFLERHSRFEEATRIYDWAIQVASKTADPNALAIAKGNALDSKAGYLERTGDKTQASKLYDQAIEVASKTESAAPFSESAAIDEKAAFLERQGNLIEANKLYDRSIEVASGSNNPDVTALTKSRAILAKADFLERIHDFNHATNLHDEAFRVANTFSSNENIRAFGTARALSEKALFLQRTQEHKTPQSFGKSATMWNSAEWYLAVGPDTDATETNIDSGESFTQGALRRRIGGQPRLGDSLHPF